jgi:predicted permease
METLWQDIRYGARMLAKSPGFTAVALLTLALGVGANTAIFSLLDQVLLRQLPVQKPGELVSLRSTGPFSGHVWSDSDDGESFSFPMYRDLRERNTVFSGLLARHPVSVSVAFRSETDRVSGELVSGNYFDVLGVRPALGRLFTLEDDRLPGAHPVVVLSHGYWVRRVGGDPTILNQTLLVNGNPMTVVGVAPAGFTGVQVGTLPDVFVPMMMKAQITPNWNGLESYTDYWAHAIGRLKLGETRAQAEAGLKVLYRSLLEAQIARSPGRAPSGERRERFLNKKILLDDGSHGHMTLQRDARTPLLLLMGTVGLVLLIACSNVANLMIARSASRYREFAIRTAIGAGRWQLVRQMLVESVMLFLVGGALAIVIASWVGSALVSVFLPDEMQGITASLDARILFFNFCLAVVAGLLFGLAPALRSTRANVISALKDQGTAVSAGASLVSFRKALVAGQMALTLLLLIVAGLFVRSLHNLRHVDLGVRADHVLEFSVAPELSGYDPVRTSVFVTRLSESIAALPGVEAVSAATVPVFANSDEDGNFTFEGYEAKEGENTNLFKNCVGPRHFSTLGIPLLAGREFTAQDDAQSPEVAILSESAVRRFFPNRNPLGARIGVGAGNGVKLEIQIVGVVRDSRHTSVRKDPQKFVYFPYTQKRGLGSATFYVRAMGQPELLAASLRGAVRALDANLPVFGMKTLETQIDESLYAERLTTLLTTSFGLLAALLAATGVYGVLAYTVAQRMREIGIRLALGAMRGDVLWLVMRDVARMALAGLAIGVPAAYGLGRLAESVLYGVQAGDLVTFAAGTALMIAVALLAGYLPAHHASRMDPMVALRYE